MRLFFDLFLDLKVFSILLNKILGRWESVILHLVTTIWYVVLLLFQSFSFLLFSRSREETFLIRGGGLPQRTFTSEARPLHACQDQVSRLLFRRLKVILCEVGTLRALLKQQIQLLMVHVYNFAVTRQVLDSV